MENIYPVLLTAPTSLHKFCELTETTHHGLNNYIDTKAKCRWRLEIVQVKGTVSQDFLLQVFFHESSSPQLLKIKLGGHFKFFSKIHREICKTRCTTDIKTPVANVPPVTTTPAVNSPLVPLMLLIPVSNLPQISTIPTQIFPWFKPLWWQIATGLNNTWGKFASVNDTGGKKREQYQTAYNLK